MWWLPAGHGPILKGRPVLVRDCTPRDPMIFWGKLGSLFCPKFFPGVAVALLRICLTRWEAADAGGTTLSIASWCDVTPGSPLPAWSQRRLWARLPYNHAVLRGKRVILEPCYAAPRWCIKCAARLTILHEGITLLLRDVWPPPVRGPSIRRAPRVRFILDHYLVAGRNGLWVYLPHIYLGLRRPIPMALRKTNSTIS